jgi:hypothetical protein
MEDETKLACPKRLKASLCLGAAAEECNWFSPLVAASNQFEDEG